MTDPTHFFLMGEPILTHPGDQRIAKSSGKHLTLHGPTLTIRDIQSRAAAWMDRERRKRAEEAHQATVEGKESERQ